MRSNMLYKEDWLLSQERLKAWWEHELIDRAVIQVTSPRWEVERLAEWDNWGFARNPSHPEVTISGFESWCAQTYFGGEAYPNLWVNLGPGIMGAYLGASPRFLARTVWFETPRAWKDLEELEFDPENEWWQLTKRITSRALEAGEGKFCVGITDLGGITDIAASLRGSKSLVLDLFRHPNKVKDLSSWILKLWHRYYDELQGIMEETMDGSSAWMGIWSPKRWYPIQCDFSAMISPKQFEEFALPYLREQCRRLDHTIYHWDGPGQIPHLDLLLSIPELDGIQWTPGAGQPPPDSPRWFPLYKRIQERGKLLVLLGVSKESVKRLLSELSPRELLMRTQCDSEEEARNLLEEVQSWTA